jgi:CHASE2 domain
MRYPIKVVFCLALGASALCRAESAFVAVFVDAKTEARLGAFPYDRAILGKAIDALAEQGAKGVVMKFFLDQPRSAGDEALAISMLKMPTVLQARCDDVEPGANTLDERFSKPIIGKLEFPVSCESGWIPIPALQKNAANVCFADQTAVDELPLRLRYKGRAVNSLYACALTLARKPVPQPDASGKRKVELRKSPRIEPISLIDVLDGKTNRAVIFGKIVVLGYEGSKAASFETAIGKLNAHRAFMANLSVLELAAE